MYELARYYGSEPVSLKQIAENQGLSAGYLEHLIVALKHAQLVHAVRGSKGGYILARNPQEISLKDIILALEGPVAPVPCVGEQHQCDRNDDCVFSDIWKDLSRTISNYLESITLNDIIQQFEEIKRNRCEEICL